MEFRLLLVVVAGICAAAPAARADELLPKYVTPQVKLAVQKGLNYLVKHQASNGSYQSSPDGARYPVSMTALAGMAFLANGNTTSRGPHHEPVSRIVRYLLGQQDRTGLIASGGENGRPMYGHGFSLLFLATAYGMESDARVRRRMHEMIEKAITLTARGQSPAGGWTYNPGGGDEGSVTITQMQALRAAHNAGFTVPGATVDKGVRYLERCKTPQGGIRYALHSGSDTRLAISAAAIACLYSAGEYDSPLAESCLEFVFGRFQASKSKFSKGGGHDYYTHLYAAQAFYQAGDEYWDEYFPDARDQILKLQDGKGAWPGDGIGPTYGTSIALIVLQLPYKFLPIYQR